MRKTLLTLSTVALCTISTAFAQDTTQPKKPEFKPSGKISTTIFTNATTSLIGDSVATTGFNFDRAYLGYSYQATENFTSTIIVDVAGLSETTDKNVQLNKRMMYLRMANVKYTKDNLSLYMGIFDLNSFKLQQATWGKRYLYRSFQDQHKFAQAADIGVLVEYKILDKLQLDFSVTNGEGFTQIQKDKDFTYTLGTTITPIKPLTIRFYGDYTAKSNEPITLGAFASIQATDDLLLSGEFNKKLNQNNVLNNDLQGISLYGNYALNKEFSLFARYDNLSSNTLSGEQTAWNFGNDGEAVIAGLEYSPAKGVKIAADFQNWLSADATKETKTLVGLHTEIKF